MNNRVALSGAIVCALVAGCASYSERVIEKPVPASTTTHRTVTTEVSPGPPTAPPTTVYTTTTR
jgi:hypothetical protein